MERAFLEGLSLEEETIEAILGEHSRIVGDIQFGHTLEKAVSAAGGRNLKAISALLDLDALRGSQEQDKAVGAALKALKRESGYLFEQPRQPYSAGHAAQTQHDYTMEELGSMSMAEYRRFRNGQ